MKFNLFYSSILLFLFSNSVLAKVNLQQAQKLGEELSPIGAQMSANEDGRIPSYTGGLKASSTDDPLNNIFAHESPLFTITGDNYLQHTKNLSDGQRALFEKYPSSYKLSLIHISEPTRPY